MIGKVILKPHNMKDVVARLVEELTEGRDVEVSDYCVIANLAIHLPLSCGVTFVRHDEEDTVTYDMEGMRACIRYGFECRPLSDYPSIASDFVEPTYDEG